MQTQIERRPTAVRATKQVGYAIAIGVNAAMIYIANHLLAWEFPPFLTQDFERVLTIINVSLGASMVANLMYIVYDDAWFKSLSQVGVNLIGLAATIRIWQVFPFDFTPYAVDWSLVARFVLVVALVGTAIGTVVEIGKLATGAVRRLNN